MGEFGAVSVISGEGEELEEHEERPHIDRSAFSHSCSLLATRALCGQAQQSTCTFDMHLTSTTSWPCSAPAGNILGKTQTLTLFVESAYKVGRRGRLC